MRAIASGAEGFLRAVTDELAVFTDNNGTWIRALEIDTGLVRWELKGWSLDGRASVMADGSIAATIGDGGNWAVRLVSPEGEVTDLTPPASAMLDVWTQVSTPTTVVVATESFGEGLADPAGARASLLRPADSKPLATSITVVPAE